MRHLVLRAGTGTTERLADQLVNFFVPFHNAVTAEGYQLIATI